MDCGEKGRNERCGSSQISPLVWTTPLKANYGGAMDGIEHPWWLRCWGTWVWSLGREDPLEEETATHSSIHDWEIPWTEEPGGLQSTGSQRVGHELVTKTTSSSYPDTLTSPHCTWTGKAQEPFLWCEWKLKPQYCGAPFLLLRVAKNFSSMWWGYRGTRKLVYSSVQFSCSLVSNSLRPDELPHIRLLCPSPTPRVYSNSCPLSQWCHPTISSSVIPSPPAFSLSQHQGLFKWVRSLHQVAVVLEFQLQHQCFQWTLRTDLL